MFVLEGKFLPYIYSCLWQRRYLRESVRLEADREERGVAMKRKMFKRLACLLMAICMLAAEAMMVGAAELPGIQPVSQTETTDSGESEDDGLVLGVVQMPMTRGLGDVMEDGVRLRKGPSTSATILELMYFGEAVYIDITTSASVSGWYYVQRAKTGTWGWAKADYIAKKL